MKTKIIALSVAATVIISLVASGTLAQFTDTETTTDNQFCAGTIDIEIDPNEGQTVKTVEGTMDLKPCQVGYLEFDITNVGTNPADIWKHIKNVENEENGVVEPEQEYYDEYPESVNWLMSNWIHYDMSLCSYSEECYDEADFCHYDNNEPGYSFDVCRVTGGGMVKWTLALEPDLPSLSHSAVQLVLSSDGATPDFQVGCNSHEADPLYKPYDGGWGAATSDLPDGMYVTGNCGDENFEIGVPMSYLSCPDFYWAMNVEADFAGTDGSDMYRSSSCWGWGDIDYWQDSCNCIVLIDENEGFFLTKDDPEKEIECHCMYLGELQPGESMHVIQSYHLDGSVENWAQSDCVSFDIDVIAQQSEGNPTEAPCDQELAGHGKFNQ